MYRIVYLFLIATSVQAFDFGALKNAAIRVGASGGIAALNTYGQGGTASNALASGFNKSLSVATTKPPATLAETVNSTKKSLLAAYKKNAVALAGINPNWKKDIETTYAALNNFSKNPTTNVAIQTKTKAYVLKANNIMKLASLLVKMNGTLKPNDVMWNTVIDPITIAKTSDLVNFDDATSALTALTITVTEFQEVLENLPFSASVKVSMDMLTQYTTTPSIDAAINKKLQTTIPTANYQATAIPTIFASLASTNPLSPGDDQWSFLIPYDKSKKYDQSGNVSTNISYDPLKSILSDGVKAIPGGVKGFAQNNQNQLKTFGIRQAFAQTKAKQEPILSDAITRALEPLQQTLSSLDSDSLSTLETINFSPKLFVNLLEIFSKNLHLTSPLQLENILKLVKVSQTISVTLPHVVQSQWTILPGDSLWSFFVDAQGKTYSIASLAAMAASHSLNQAVQTNMETMPSLSDVTSAFNSLNTSYQQYETQLKANIDPQWITNIEETGTKLDILSKSTILDSSAAPVVITANNMVKAFPMLAQTAGGTPGDELWSTLVKDGQYYDLDGAELP